MVRFFNPFTRLQKVLRERRSVSQLNALERIRDAYRRSGSEPGGYLFAHTVAGTIRRDVHTDDLPEVERLGLLAALEDPDVPDGNKPIIAARLAENERRHHTRPER